MTRVLGRVVVERCHLGNECLVGEGKGLNWSRSGLEKK